MKNLREAVDSAVEKNGQLKAIDGRMLPVRHKHSSLNTLLQSAGSIVCKHWVVNFHAILKQKGYVVGKDFIQHAWIHDEVVVSFNPKTITFDILFETSKEAMTKAEKDLNIRLKLDVSGQEGDNYSEIH